MRKRRRVGIVGEGVERMLKKSGAGVWDMGRKGAASGRPRKVRE